MAVEQRDVASELGLMKLVHRRSISAPRCERTLEWKLKPRVPRFQ